MRRYKTKREKKPFELELEKREIFAEDIMYCCDISITAARDRVQEKVDFKVSEIKKLKEHFGMTKEEAWALFIEKGESSIE